MDYSKFIESLKGLIKDDTSVEEATQIAGIINDAETLKSDHETLINNHEKLRQEYIKTIQNGGITTKNPNDDTPPKEKDFSDYVDDVIAKRK